MHSQLFVVVLDRNASGLACQAEFKCVTMAAIQSCTWPAHSKVCTIPAMVLPGSSDGVCYCIHKDVICLNY